MFGKKLFMPLVCSALFGLAACSSDSSNPSVPGENPGENGVPGENGGSTPTPSSVPLSAGANPAVPEAMYTSWLGYHFTTLEAEKATYPSIASNFAEVFTPAFQPAGRVVWSTQSSGGYKTDCYVEDAAVPDMKYRACTVSEGIGYGMLLSTFQGDTDTFTRLWNYSRAIRAYRGSALTAWITKSFDYRNVDNSSATDADLDIATSLILMHIKTGEQAYLSDALSIAGAIWDTEINPTTKLIYSGNTDMWYGANPTYNLSYFSPVALRLFAKYDTTHDWNAVIANMYEYMIKVQDAGTGVFPDWSDASGIAVNPPNGAAGKNESTYTWYTFNKESVRIPWRIAWDYYWYEDANAKKVLTKLNEFIVGKSGGDPTSLALAANYSWDPTKADKTGATVVSSQWLSAWCATGLAGNADWLDKCTAAVNARMPGNNGSSYFPDILLVMYAQLLNGKYVRPF